VDRPVTARTRYVVIGIGALALAVAVGLLLALVLRSLAAPQPQSQGSAPPTAPPPATAPAPAPVAPAPSEARPEAGRNECVDSLGDGSVDLDSVQLELNDGDLVAQFRFATPLSASDVGFGLNIERNGDKAYLLGVSLREGEVDRVFVQDFDRSDTDDLDTDDAAIDGSVVTVLFPKSAIKRLGNDWSWSAFANSPGGTLDTCPGGSQRLEFER
jgi:hypothetical protein